MLDRSASSMPMRTAASRRSKLRMTRSWLRPSRASTRTRTATCRRTSTQRWVSRWTAARSRSPSQRRLRRTPRRRSSSRLPSMKQEAGRKPGLFHWENWPSAVFRTWLRCCATEDAELALLRGWAEEGFERQRLLEGKALGEIAANRSQPLKRGLVVDALGNAMHAHDLARLCDRDDDRLRQLVLHRGSGQLGIDLHRTQGARAEHGQGARVEAEVVDYQETAHLLAHLHEALHLGLALHAGKLGDFKADVLGRHAGDAEAGGHALCEVLILERTDRQVHREAGRLGVPDRIAMLAKPGEQALHDDSIEHRAFAAL